MNCELRELQLVELEILDEFDRICKENNLTYFLSSGTLLGAVRHKGFIPWDDDIDVCMPIKDYRRLCRIAPAALKKDYFFQNYQTDQCYWAFAKVRKNNTTCIESGWENKKIHQGVWIDVFPLIAVPENERKVKEIKSVQDKMRKILKMKFDSINGKKLGGKRSVIKYIPISLLRRIVSVVNLIIYKPHTKSKKCDWIWGEGNISPKFPSELFVGCADIEFEKKMYPAQKRWDEYLSLEYGDYMTPPPPEKRNGGSHTISIVDLEKDYSEYIK